jgi:hypothetical protein
MAERGKRMATSGVDSIRKEARFVHGRNAMAAFSDCRVPKETPCISHGTLQPQTIAQHQTLTNADANICQDFITTMRREVKHQKQPTTLKQWLGPSVNVFNLSTFSQCQ